MANHVAALAVCLLVGLAGCEAFQSVAMDESAPNVVYWPGPGVKVWPAGDREMAARDLEAQVRAWTDGWLEANGCNGWQSGPRFEELPGGRVVVTCHEYSGRLDLEHGQEVRYTAVGVFGRGGEGWRLVAEIRDVDVERMNWDEASSTVVPASSGDGVIALRLVEAGGAGRVEAMRVPEGLRRLSVFGEERWIGLAGTDWVGGSVRGDELAVDFRQPMQGLPLRDEFRTAWLWGGAIVVVSNGWVIDMETGVISQLDGVEGPRVYQMATNTIGHDRVLFGSSIVRIGRDGRVLERVPLDLPAGHRLMEMDLSGCWVLTRGPNNDILSTPGPLWVLRINPDTGKVVDRERLPTGGIGAFVSAEARG